MILKRSLKGIVEKCLTKEIKLLISAITKRTVDETVYKILSDKQEISDFIVDDKLDLRKNPELFEKLLGKG